MKGRGREMEGLLIRGGREVKGGEEKKGEGREGPPGYYGFPVSRGARIVTVHHGFVAQCAWK